MPVNTGMGANTVVNIGAVGLAGAFLGMPAEALALGAFAGALINGRNAPSGGWRVLTGILTGMLLAGAFSPVAVLALMHLLPFGAAAEQPLNIAVPVLIGGCWSWAAPLIGDALKRLLAGWLNKTGGDK